MAWRTYAVQVDGFPPFVMSAPSRGKARAESYRSWREARPRARFGDFLQRSRVVACEPPADDGYDYVRRYYGVDPRIGDRVYVLGSKGRSNAKHGVVTYPGLTTASVHVAFDGHDFAMRVHPSEIRFEAVRS